MANTTNLLLSLLLITLLSSLLIRPSESTERRFTKQGLAQFTGECLYGHNSLRASLGLGLPRLQWNTTLTKYAKWRLNQLRGSCAMIHCDSDYGENLFWGQGGGWTAAEAVAAWAAEQANYNYELNTCLPNSDCTHYTQMVWETTTMMGCAKIKCLSGDILIACEYSPYGNIFEERPYAGEEPRIEFRGGIF